MNIIAKTTLIFGKFFAFIERLIDDLMSQRIFFHKFETMKQVIFILLLFMSSVSMAQSDIERALDNAEQELYRLEQIKSEMATELVQKGQVPKENEQYIQAEQAYKVQLIKTKDLRKEYKKVQRAQKRTQVANAPQGNMQGRPASPTYNPQAGVPGTVPTGPTQAELQKQALKQRKAEIKAMKQQINQLKKEQKALIEQAEAAGQAPMSQPQVQAYDRKIMEKQDELVRLQAAPIDTGIKNAQNVPVQQPMDNGMEQRQVAYPPIKEKEPKPERKVKLPLFKKDKTEEQVDVVEKSTVPAIDIPEIGLTTILFEKFSSDISKEYDLYLNYVAKQMQDNPALLLNIDAFTDNSEKNRVSMQITAGMANAVAQAMVNRGVSPARLNIKANGSRKPVGDNGTFFGQARNRRVELSFAAQ